MADKKKVCDDLIISNLYYSIVLPNKFKNSNFEFSSVLGYPVQKLLS